MTMHFHEYTLHNIGAGVAVARILGECPVGPAHSNCKFATVNAYEWTDTVLRTSVEEDSADHTHTIAVVDIVTGTGDITAPSTLTTCGRGHANCYCSAATTKRLATAVDLNEEATTGAAGSGTHRHTYISRAAQSGLYYKVSDGQCPSGHDDCLAESIGTKNLIGQNDQNYYTEYNTPGVIHPSDDVARVSSIRRIYHPGLYRMEIALGDLGFEWDVSEVGMRLIPDEVKEPEVPEEPTGAPGTGTPMPYTDYEYPAMSPEDTAALDILLGFKRGPGGFILPESLAPTTGEVAIAASIAKKKALWADKGYQPYDLFTPEEKEYIAKHYKPKFEM